MNTGEIQRLLEKFYNGETTEAEETLLKEFFSEENVPAEFADEKDIFRFFAKSISIPEPSPGFEEKIISELDSANRESRKSRQLRIYGIFTGIAAGIALIAGSYYFFIHQPGPRDTYSDPQIAYAETMKILYNVSVRLNNGTNTLKPVGRINESTAILGDKMRPLEKVSRTVDALNMIDNEKQKNK